MAAHTDNAIVISAPMDVVLEHDQRPDVLAASVQ